MGLSGKLLQIIALPGVLIIIVFAIVAAAAATTTTIPKIDCPRKCGNVTIPFPFGFTKGCYLDESLKIKCASREPMIGNIPVRNISIDTHEVHVMTLVARNCPEKPGPCSTTNLYSRCEDTVPDKNNPSLWLSRYTISNSKNKFTVIGCDTSAYLTGYQNREEYKIGCSSQCPSLNNVVNGACSGVGCCEVAFPDGLKNISVEVQSFQNHSEVFKFNPCGYAFVVEKSKFNFSADYLRNYTDKRVPLVLDWAVGNLTCEEARNKPNFACKDINSECIDNQTRPDGYRCKCKQGYRGNPYLLQGQGGCQDIDECLNPTLNNCTRQCTNGIGNYTCGCPRWYRGDGRKDGEGCSVDLAIAIKVSIGIGIGLIAMLGGSSWLFLVLQKKKYIKLKAKLFQQNGGLILERRLRALGSTKKAKIFTFEELKLATKNYRESRIIGRGGFGIVYKGFLPNNTIVAIKKSKTVDPDQVDQFINEIVLLSQIDHKNVVKLLGCCLETQVPLLVYEFVSQEDHMDEILDKRIVEEENNEQIKEVVKLAERCLRVKGDERPSMKELALELEQIRMIETHLWVNAQSNLEEAKHLHGVTSDAYENGGSSGTTAAFDSMKDNVMSTLGDGR
ncbi:hypothetical protein FH972_018096 [Carpinus fangiana]|uniref:Protein kinase domain-containing protein n=1 Tax=Carpinus fangiana TaxID=176857 RepID=A0A5N6RL77_9ROSI|nr:hypothetical protein FH972_018096 [Carpinus fangiana]